MVWDAFRRRVRELRGEALDNWPAAVTDVRLHSAVVAGRPAGVHVWCACTAPARGLRKSTLMHCAIPAGSGSSGSGEVVHVPVAALRSVWMDGECGVGASVVIVADKGRQWTHAQIDYHQGPDPWVRFAECAAPEGRTAPGRHEGDWYYARGGRGGRLLAFVRGRNVVAYDTATATEAQLTWAAAEGVQYGAVDLPMEEELGRSTGMFWAPPSSAQTPNVDMLLCARVDERAVLGVGLPELPVESKINPLGTLVPAPTALFADDSYGWADGCPSAEGPLTEHHRYPRPGTPTAATGWVVVEVEHGPAGIGRRRVRALRGAARLQAAFPWCEYVVRAGWLPADSQPAVWFQLLDRPQRRTAIVRVPLACFDAGTDQPTDPLEALPPPSMAGAPRIDVLYEEQQPNAWINLSHGHRFLARSSTARCVRFILATERAGGFCHLHLVTSHLCRPSAGAVAHARVETAALTAGPWPVTADGPLFVDERRRVVFFAARRPNPLTENLFAVDYGPALAEASPVPQPPEPQQLTMMGYTHNHFAFDATGAYFACQSSNLATPTRHCVYQIAYGSGGRVAAQCLAALEPCCGPAMVGAQGALADSVHRVPSARASKRLSGASTASSLSVRSMSVESLAPDEFFVERLLAKLRASGQQIQHSALASDLAKLKRLTPAYVSQRVTKAVRSALPFCSTPATVPLHLFSAILPQPPPLPPRPNGLPRRAAARIRNVHALPPPPPPLLRSSLTAASHAFVARETLLGTHAALRQQCPGGDPVPRLFCFPVPRVGGSTPDAYDLLFGHVYLPPDFAPGERYPVVVNAYGGPQCQLVTNAYAYPRHRRLAMLTRMGAGAPDDDDVDDSASLWTRPPSLAASDADAGPTRRAATRSLYMSAEAELAGVASAEAARHPGIATTQCLAPRAVVVVCIDGRGTACRGLAFEAAIRGQLGQIEVDDIACALEYLIEYGTACLEPTTSAAPGWCRAVVSTTPPGPDAAVPRPPVFAPPGAAAPLLPADHWDPPPPPAERGPFVDRARVAIHGWSYGGYVALRAMAARPELFRVAIAGAPVVRWDWYCAAYIERYLGVLPPPGAADDVATRAAYAQASVTAVAAKLAAAAGRILLVHGWGDDNVHIAHTAALVRELRRHTPEPPGVAVYANERHGLRLPASNEHYETLLAYWLFRALQP
ncbi:hypothetical protein H4R21_001035 [Coemansia helicoidea]|uniref:Uncharacterized protein n=1 Tax=Coemansia helicoidea TaxID=1286919 RepID=A0ACC1LEP5_9FUNG|nr:hypothetical protein H4R21_001035 [Coemansia helicoidea]